MRTKTILRAIDCVKINDDMRQNNHTRVIIIFLCFVILYFINENFVLAQEIEISFSCKDAKEKIDTVITVNLNSNTYVKFPGNKKLLLVKSLNENERQIDREHRLEYYPGDKFLYRCISGNNTSLIIDTSIVSQTIIPEFYACTDYEGNNYATIKIGTQLWMAENLRTKYFENGETIPTTASVTQDIKNESSPIYQWVYNNDEKFEQIFGRLYSWDAVMDKRSICPSGWHIPSKEEYETLINYLGGTDRAGLQLKEQGNIYWQVHPLYAGNNSSGFTAKPGGYRINNPKNEFNGMGMGCYFWTTTPDVYPYHIGIFFDNTNAYISSKHHPKFHGFSVRCIKTVSVK